MLTSTLVAVTVLVLASAATVVILARKATLPLWVTHSFMAPALAKHVRGSSYFASCCLSYTIGGMLCWAIMYQPRFAGAEHPALHLSGFPYHVEGLLCCAQGILSYLADYVRRQGERRERERER